jgi:kynurenine formamidase
MKIVDLSRELYHRTPSYPGHPPIIHGAWKNHEEALAESGNVWGLASMFISMADHGGTHIDAPRHFGPGGISIDRYPLEKCIVPGICLDLQHIAPRAEITPADLEDAVKKAGVGVPSGGTVLLCTEWLAERGIVHFGIDSMRPGPDSDVNLLVHKACLDLDITHIESLCNLEALLGKGQFTFIGLPLKWREGTASPIRAVAVFDM